MPRNIKQRRGKKMISPYTAEQLQEIRHLAKAKTAVQISEITGRSWTSLQGLAQRHGFKFRAVSQFGAKQELP
jgi:hypothetical protein